MDLNTEHQVIDKNGKVNYGVIDHPVKTIDHRRFTLKTPMGFPIPKILNGLMEKRFIFFGVSGSDIIAGLALIDLKYLGMGFFYAYDRKSRTLIDRRKITHPLSVRIKPCPEEPTGRFFSFGLNLAIGEQEVTARASGLSLEARFQLQATKPLRVCTRAGYRGWVYTQKTTPIPLSGKITMNGRQFELSSPQHMAFIDWSMGFMRRETYWNWASSACSLPDGRAFGLNLACGVNESGFTENAFWLNGERHKVDTVNFQYHADDFMQPWRIRSFDGKVDLEFFPEAHRDEHTNALVVATKFTQLIGVFSGKIVPASGGGEIIRDCPGWVEDHYARW